MWEFCLQLENQHQCDMFFSELQQQLKNYKGVITRLENSILFAYTQSQVKHIIKTHIVKYIIFDYKKKYFSEKLKNVDLSEVKKQALIKVLSLFDNNFDALFITAELVIKDKLILESFIRFSLKDLLSKWDEIVALILNNSFYLFCSGTYNELLKFLLNTLDTKWAEVNIVIKDNELTVFDKTFKQCLIKNSDNVVILTELIGFSPQVINIYCNEIVDSPVFNSILDIFQERVKIKPLTNIKKC